MNLPPKPKRDNEPVSAQGALGVIPRHSVNRPRLLFQVAPPTKSDTLPNLPTSIPPGESPLKKAGNPLEGGNKPKSEKGLTKQKQMKVLWAIEEAYTNILRLEDIAQELQSLTEEERTQRMEESMEIFQTIQNLITTPIEGMKTEEYILHFVKYPKGTRILRRAFNLLSTEVIYSYFLSLLRVFDQLNLLDPQAPAEHVSSFLVSVMNPIGLLLEQLEFSKIIEWFEIIANMSLFSVFSIARSKIGLTLFEMLFVRAHQLKQKEPSPQDLKAWDSLFGKFFVLMEHNYFNLLSTIEPFFSQEIWVFFTLLALHATVEQRYALLSEILVRISEVLQNPSIGGEEKEMVTRVLWAMNIKPEDLAQ